MSQSLSPQEMARLRGEVPSKMVGLAIALRDELKPQQAIFIGAHHLVITHEITREEFLDRVNRNSRRATAEFAGSRRDLATVKQANAPPEHEPGMHYYAADALEDFTANSLKKGKAS